MRLLALCLVAAGPAMAAGIEVEVGGGFLRALRDDTSSTYPWAPEVSARVGVKVAEVASIGARFVGILGNEASDFQSGASFNTFDASAFRATAGFVDARVHSLGSFQLWGGVGLGIGHLIGLQATNSFEHPPLRGHSNFALQLSSGIRFGKTVSIGPEVSWTLFTGVEQKGTAVSGLIDRTGLGVSALSIFMTVGGIAWQ
jgi:hypothetical protein